ncbi:MAG: rhodanese-like domain-containing protein [Candidatus Nitrotoga sp.]
MEKITRILNTAKQRAKDMKLPYTGALLPEEAHELLQAKPTTKLVDVRTRAECDWVGRVPNAVEIEWQSYPDMQRNEQFLVQLEQAISKEVPVFFICRSGGRSGAAATAATQAGYTECYNVLEGFEGDKDEEGHRSLKNGWQAKKLPWSQS